MDDRLHGERGRDRRPKTRTVLGHHPRVRRDLELARSLGLTLHQFDRLPDSERSYWIAEWELKRSLCPDCGNPLEECTDAKRPWYPYRRICYATMEREAAQAAYSALHDEQGYHDGTFTRWAKDRSDEFPYAATWGVAIGVAEYDLAPHDMFTTEVDASPAGPVSVADESG